MTQRSEIAPSTLGVELTEDGIAVEYLDGRRVFYHGVPTKAEESVTTTPGKDVHVLVTDESESEGVLVYVDDRKTDDDILEDAGVGRVVLEKGDRVSLFPGVTAERKGFRYEIAADLDAVDGRVLVFQEDEMSEQRYEIVREA